jgi:hypothetical protein
MRRADRLLVALAGLLAAATLARLPASWASGNALNHVSGAWMALADDLARGTFYRPLEAAGLFYGGTRFFPLAFSLHAALLRMGAPLLPAGYALSLAAGLLLAAGAFLLLRRVGLRRTAAAAFAVLAFAGFGAQLALTAVRGDLLAVALEALGLAAASQAAVPARGRGVWLGLAALAFVLAFAAKPTALTAPATADAFLLRRGARRPALALALLVAAGAAAVVGATEALSRGRFLELLAACASGGVGPRDLLRGPARLAQLLGIEDRAGAVLLAAALVALGSAAPHRARGWRAPEHAGLLLAALWLGAALAGALAVLASPGTGVNHLLEVEAASAIALGAAAASTSSRGARLAPLAAALGGLALVAALWREDLRGSRLAEIRAAIAAAPPGRILSEDPLVPLLAGERAALLDPWMFRLAAERDPDLARPLLARLAAGVLGAVVLFRDVGSEEARDWYARGNLGLGPVAEVRRRYALALHAGRYFVYLPASSRPAPLAPPPEAATLTTLGPSRERARARARARNQDRW